MWLTPKLSLLYNNISTTQLYAELQRNKAIEVEREIMPIIGIIAITGCLSILIFGLANYDIYLFGCSSYLVLLWDIIGVIIYLYNIVCAIRTKRTSIWKPILGAILCVISIAIIVLIVYLDPHWVW